MTETREEAARRLAEARGWVYSEQVNFGQYIAPGFILTHSEHGQDYDEVYEYPCAEDDLTTHLAFVGWILEQFPTYDASIVVVRGCALVNLMQSIHDPREYMPEPQGGEGIDPSWAAVLAAAAEAKE